MRRRGCLFLNHWQLHVALWFRPIYFTLGALRSALQCEMSICCLQPPPLSPFSLFLFIYLLFVFLNSHFLFVEAHVGFMPVCFQTLRLQRMRPRSPRWRPKRGSTRTRLDAEDLQVRQLRFTSQRCLGNGMHLHRVLWKTDSFLDSYTFMVKMWLQPISGCQTVT